MSAFGAKADIRNLIMSQFEFIDMRSDGLLISVHGKVY